MTITERPDEPDPFVLAGMNKEFERRRRSVADALRHLADEVEGQESAKAIISNVTNAIPNLSLTSLVAIDIERHAYQGSLPAMGRCVATTVTADGVTLQCQKVRIPGQQHRHVGYVLDEHSNVVDTQHWGS